MGIKKKRLVKLERQVKRDFVIFVVVIVCVILPLLMLIAMYAPGQIGFTKK